MRDVVSQEKQAAKISRRCTEEKEELQPDLLIQGGRLSEEEASLSSCVTLMLGLPPNSLNLLCHFLGITITISF